MYGEKEADQKRVKLSTKIIGGKPERIMLLNVVEAGQPDVNKLGILSSSAAISLVKLADMTNVGATDEMLAHNYLFRWAVGDLTNPQSAPQLRCCPNPSNPNLVDIQPVVGGDQRQMMMACYPQHLTGRYLLVAPETFLNRRTYEQTVAELVRVLNAHRPDKQAHEWELLRQVFGHACKIPEPPKHAGMVGGPGLGYNPAQGQPQTQQGFAQFGQQPQQPVPAQQQQGFMQQPQQFGAPMGMPMGMQQPQQFAPQQMPPAATPVPTQASQFNTPGWESTTPPEDEVPMTTFAPPPQMPTAPIQSAYPGGMAQPQQPQMPAAVGAAMAAAQVSHTPQGAPLPGQVPGAPAGWTKEQFIAKIKADAAAKAVKK